MFVTCNIQYKFDACNLVKLENNAVGNCYCLWYTCLEVFALFGFAKF